jgi:hypothetical protein
MHVKQLPVSCPPNARYSHTVPFLYEITTTKNRQFHCSRDDTHVWALLPTHLDVDFKAVRPKTRYERHHAASRISSYLLKSCTTTSKRYSK